MTTSIEKSLAVEIFEKATKCCFKCQEQKEKMFPSKDCTLFLCKDCGVYFFSIFKELKETGTTNKVALDIRDHTNSISYCNWHQDKVNVFYQDVFFFQGNTPPGCCSDCIKKAANL